MSMPLAPLMRFMPAIAIACVAATSIAALASEQSTKDGAFTSEQAERGKNVYERSCVNCHQTDFYRERLARWENKPVGQLFEVVSTTMPADNIGALLTSEYIDVLTYIFAITGSPSGNSELTTDNMDAVLVGPAQ